MSIKIGGSGVTFNDGTTMATKRQAAAAWVFFNGSAQVINSYNVASISHFATGFYGVNYSTAIDSAVGSFTACGGQGGVPGNGDSLQCGGRLYYEGSTTRMVVSFSTSPAQNYINPAWCCLAAYT